MGCSPRNASIASTYVHRSCGRMLNAAQVLEDIAEAMRCGSIPFGGWSNNCVTSEIRRSRSSLVTDQLLTVGKLRYSR